MVGSITTNTGTVAGVQTSQKSAAAKPAADRDAVQDGAVSHTDDTAKARTDTADSRVQALTDPDLNNEGAKAAATHIRDALATQPLSIANREPDAVRGLLQAS